MRAVFLAAATLAGCAYQADSFHTTTQPFAGQHASVGCLDLGVDRRADLPDGDVVVAYAFGNRCDHPVVVDLASVAVVGRTTDGQPATLRAYDPRGELTSLRLDGRTVGQEAIAYPNAAPLDEVCVDAASIGHAAPVAWLCFASRPQLSEVP